MCNGEEGSFRVLVENEACGIVGHRCAKAVTVYFQGGLIVMQDGEVPTVHTYPQSLSKTHETHSSVAVHYKDLK